MRPGDRVNLLKRLATRLAEPDYKSDDLDLVLDQFGFPTPDLWNFTGSQRDYALANLRRGTDEALIELDGYLFDRPSRGS